MTKREKIEALLRLATKNPSEKEAMSALAKARELSARWGILVDENELERPEGVVERIVDLYGTRGPYDKVPLWQRKIAGMLAEPFRTQMLSSPRYLGVVGFSQDCEFAIEAINFAISVFTPLFRKALEEARQYHWTSADSRNYRELYLLGFCEGIQEVFKKQEEIGLMVVVPDQVVEYMKPFKKSKISFKDPATLADAVAVDRGRRDAIDAHSRERLSGI